MSRKDKEKLATLAWTCQQTLATDRQTLSYIGRGDMRAIIAAAKELGIMPIWRSTEAPKV